ncbi:tyrosine--tRNA ligase [bacterium]|nr:tyrosine--tRNA ligase [bacterium]
MTTETEPIPIPDSIREEWEILTSGTVDVLPAEQFRDRLLDARAQNRPIRIKLGADPTAPDLHVGHSVQLNKLKQFQDLGHQVVFILGDFTASIGDPTGKNETRPPLSWEAIEENAKTYLDQIFMILDRDKTEVVRNSTWFNKMNFTEVIKLASRYTVARMLERDDFAKRYADQRPIHVHEFLYPLVQGWDSVEVRADIELGGTDQKFNLLVGRELMREMDMAPQCIMTLPLLVGLDGVNKMSKSLGNYIGLTEPPDEIFGKTMSVPDEMMRDYLVLALGYKEKVANGLVADAANGKLHPRDLKARIGRELVARYHGEAAGRAAQENFDRMFREKELPAEIETTALDSAGAGKMALAKLIVAAGMAPSNSEARRLIEQGGVSLNGERAADPRAEIAAGEYLLKVGKRQFKRIQLT